MIVILNRLNRTKQSNNYPETLIIDKLIKHLNVLSSMRSQQAKNDIFKKYESKDIEGRANPDPLISNMKAVFVVSRFPRTQ